MFNPDPRDTQYFSINEVYEWCKKDGPMGNPIASKRTIRYWSSIGVLPKPTRFGREMCYRGDVFFKILTVKMLTGILGHPLHEVALLMLHNRHLSAYEYYQSTLWYSYDWLTKSPASFRK